MSKNISFKVEFSFEQKNRNILRYFCKKHFDTNKKIAKTDQKFINRDYNDTAKIANKDLILTQDRVVR